MPPELKEQVTETIFKELPDKASFEDLDVVQPSVSAPVLGNKNAKNNGEATLKKKRS